MKKTKRNKKILQMLDKEKTVYQLEEAIEILKNCPKLKFDESIEISMKLGVDPKKSDQQVRGTISLPHGTGKQIKILVIAKEDKAKLALEAGADYAGADQYIEKIKNGWLEFNVIIATPDMMREVGKLGKILGPRSLMPTPKSGTVTQDVVKAINELKAGKIEFKIDKNAVINMMVAKMSFTTPQILENINVFLNAVMKSKPMSSKGNYIKNLIVSSTMGPGLSIDLQKLNLS